jgi:hypothetical protein
MADTTAIQTECEKHWQELRRQYKRLWALPLTFFPAVILIGFSGSARWHSFLPIATVWLVGGIRLD